MSSNLDSDTYRAVSEIAAISACILRDTWKYELNEHELEELLEWFERLKEATAKK